MKKIVICIALLALSACASRLPLSDNQSEILQQLSDSQASTIVKEMLSKNPEQSGLFASNGSPFNSNPNFLKFSNGVVAYSDYDEHVSGVKTSGSFNNSSGVSANVGFAHTIENFTVDFRKIETITIVSSQAVNQDFLNSTNGVQLGLKESNGNLINIDIKRELFDKAIAAIKYYSPEAEIKSGVGF